MSLSYSEALLKMRRERCPGAGVPLLHETRLYDRGNHIAVRYHATDVVRIYPDGVYILNSGGYRTRTTKNRINEFSPARIYQHDFEWYLAPSDIPFYDGMAAMCAQIADIDRIFMRKAA